MGEEDTVPLFTDTSEASLKAFVHIAKFNSLIKYSAIVIVYSLQHANRLHIALFWWFTCCNLLSKSFRMRKADVKVSGE